MCKLCDLLLHARVCVTAKAKSCSYLLLSDFVFVYVNGSLMEQQRLVVKLIRDSLATTHGHATCRERERESREKNAGISYNLEDLSSELFSLCRMSTSWRNISEMYLPQIQRHAHEERERAREQGKENWNLSHS